MCRRDGVVMYEGEPLRASLDGAHGEWWEIVDSNDVKIARFPVPPGRSVQMLPGLPPGFYRVRPEGVELKIAVLRHGAA